jgi:hypothetical protein
MYPQYAYKPLQLHRSTDRVSQEYIVNIIEDAKIEYAIQLLNNKKM